MKRAHTILGIETKSTTANLKGSLNSILKKGMTNSQTQTQGNISGREREREKYIRKGNFFIQQFIAF